MFKKYLSLFTLFFVLTSFSVLAFYPQKSLGANDHVVISQVQLSGATGLDEFVELFNPTASNIDLSTYKLTRKNSSGTEANLVASLSGTINAGGYYLIGHGVGYEGTPTLDKVYSAPSNALTNNYSVHLYANNILVDKVGFGSSPDFEGTVFATNPPADSSIQRVSNQDTDNNSVDFAVLTPSNARNTSTIVATTSPTATASPTTAPTATPVVTTSPVVTQTPTTVPTQTPTSSPVVTTQPTSTATPTATASPTETVLPVSTPAITASPTSSPIVTFTASPTLRPTTKPAKHHGRDDDYDFDLPFGFRCGFDRHEFKFKKVQFSYYKFHFGRR